MGELMAMLGLVFLLSFALAATVYIKRGPRPFLVAAAVIAGMIAALVAQRRRRTAERGRP